MPTCYRCGDDEFNFIFRGHEYCTECYVIRAAKTSHLCAIELAFPEIKFRHFINEFKVDVDMEGNGIAIISSKVGVFDEGLEASQSYQSTIHFTRGEIAHKHSELQGILTSGVPHDIMEIEPVTQ
jgi:hypothetical protein